MRRRLLLAAVIVLVVLPLGVIVAAVAVLNTDWGRDRLAGLIASATEGGPVGVRVGRITGPLPGRIGLVGLRLSDGEGEFASFERVDLSWSPWDLLRGRVTIDSVEIAGAGVDRAPALPDSPEAEQATGPPSLEFPTPPVAMRLEALRISGLRLGEALAGRAATLDAELAAAVDGASAVSGGWIEARTADGVARLDLDLAVVPEDGTLRASIRVHEPQGGLVAGLAGLSGRPPLDLSLTGDGTLAGWKGRLTGGFGPGAGVDLAVTVASTAEGTALAVNGTAELLRLLPDEAGRLAGPSIRLDLAARRGPDGAVTVERTAVEAAAGRLAGTAALDAGGLPTAADLTLTVADLRPLSGLSGTPLDGGAVAGLVLADGGRSARVVVTGAPVVAGTALAGLAVEATARAETALAKMPAAVGWTLEAALDTPAVPGTDLPGLLGPRLSASAAGTAATDGATARVERLSVAADGARVDATAALADGRVTAAGAAAVADLAPLSGVAGQDLAGSATLGFESTVLLDPLDVSALLDLTARGLGLGDPGLTRLAGTAPSLSAGVTLDAQNRLAVHGLTLQLAAAGATGDALVDLAGGGLEGRLDVSAPDLRAIGEAVGADIAGAGTAALALGGTLQAPTASASWRVAPLTVQGTRLSALSGSASASGLLDAPSGRVELRAAAGKETLAFATDYALAGQRLRLGGLALDGAGLRGRGNLDVDLAGPLAEGELSLAASDLRRAAAFAGAPVEGGTLDLKLGLTSRGGQGAKVTGSVRKLAIAGGTTVSSVTVSGDGRDLLGTPAGSLRIEAGEVRQGGEAVVGTALATLRADRSAAEATLSLDGERGVPYRLTAAARADLGRAPLRIAVSRLDAKVADVAIALQRPAQVTLGPAPRIDDLALRLDEGRITGGGRIDPADLDAQLAVRGMPAGLARLADPKLRLSGGIDADLSVRGPLSDPTAQVSVSAPRIRATGPAMADLPPLRAKAEARIEDRRLTASLDAAVGQGVTAELRAAARLRPGAAGAPPSLDESGPVDARLDVEAALERVSAYLPLDGGRIGGQASLHVSVSGTASDPVADGTASVSDGLVEQPAAGLYLRDVQLSARGQGERLVIERLTAAAVSGGTLRGEGALSLDVGEGMPADFRIVADRLTAMDTDEATVAVNADLALTGRLPEYRLAGTVTVLPSEIRIPDQLPPSVIELDVTEIRNGMVVRSPEGEHAGEDGGGGAPVVLDVRVDIPGQVFLRGRGLDSEWGGALTARGPADDPVVDGRIEVRRGRFDGFGRSFGFERGRVLFDGGPPGNPTLDMVLATEVAEIAAKVVVSGQAQDPKIALQSEPALPEEEILSRILFGSPRAQLSPIQALKLARSAAVLSGRLGSGGGITDRVRDTLGVDTLDVDAGGEGARGASLSVGKYVAPGVFLKLQQGLGAAGSKAVVEVELTDNITVETDVGADSQSSVGVNWKLDY